MKQMTELRWTRKLLHIAGWFAAWTWAIVAGIGGLGLIITEGPLPLTNGWFALFSGLAACPLTAWLLKRYGGIRVPEWTRFAVAFLIIVAGRLAVKIEGRGQFLPNFSR